MKKAPPLLVLLGPGCILIHYIPKTENMSLFMSETVVVLFLAVVQGIAEFLPISSSGHLAVLGQIFGLDPESNVDLNIILHAGTLLAILVFYFKTLLQLVTEVKEWKVIGMVILGSIPTAAVGLGIKKCGYEEVLFNNLWMPAIGFLITGFLLQFATRAAAREHNSLGLTDMNWKQALGIGVVQGIAVTPGISRSGSTISAALFCRLKPTESAKFSFLLAIPAIGGAAFLDLLKALKPAADAAANPSALPVWLLTAGFVVSAVIGYVSLAFLIRILNRGKLSVFSPYLYTVGALTLVLAIYRCFYPAIQ